MLTSPESAVSSILYSTVILSFDLLFPNCDAFVSVSYRIVDVSGENVLTVFRDAHTDACTHGLTGQKQYDSSQTTLGKGIKMFRAVDFLLIQKCKNVLLYMYQRTFLRMFCTFILHVTTACLQHVFNMLKHMQKRFATFFAKSLQIF